MPARGSKNVELTEAGPLAEGAGVHPQEFGSFPDRDPVWRIQVTRGGLHGFIPEIYRNLLDCTENSPSAVGSVTWDRAQSRRVARGSTEILRILLAGGGSGGSAAPVIAVAEAIAARRSDVEFLYVGTRTGPERVLVEAAGLPFQPVVTGRLRRYPTWRNVTDPGLVLLGIAQAIDLVHSFRPDVAFGAGGFATVPPLVAAKISGGKIAIHQQDVVPGLANRILAPLASLVTVALPETLGRLRGARRVVGNPVRVAIQSGDGQLGRARLGLDQVLPLVLVTGGGTGAAGLNRIVWEAAHQLVSDCEIVHLTGDGKGIPGWTHPRYHQIEFLSRDMPHIIAAADVVVSRAGMSALAEIAALKKAAIVVPMPSSHQEANAAALRLHHAAVVRDELALDADQLVTEIRSLLGDASRRAALGDAGAAMLPLTAANAIAEEILLLVREKV
ncbi:MAG: hypothetical protein EXR58_03855 [Chloroflexi bacterium]|nr:hypothetical protein [Chloroflexota bacterium]